jgi:hypothetical protein
MTLCQQCPGLRQQMPQPKSAQLINTAVNVDAAISLEFIGPLAGPVYVNSGWTKKDYFCFLLDLIL